MTEALCQRRQRAFVGGLGQRSRGRLPTWTVAARTNATARSRTGCQVGTGRLRGGARLRPAVRACGAGTADRAALGVPGRGFGGLRRAQAA